MIIKSHIRGGFRSAAEYMKEQGQNETTRLVEISDKTAKNLDEAFQNMWVTACSTKCKKPLHHISINPMKGERLTDEQVMAIVQRCEEKYGYEPGQHQRVIVEHIKDGRQHFHVIWNRVNKASNKIVWPGEHWKKSKQICREMEIELGLMHPAPKRMLRPHRKRSTSKKRVKSPKTRRGKKKSSAFRKSKNRKVTLRLRSGKRTSPVGRYNRVRQTAPLTLATIKLLKPILNASKRATPYRPEVRMMAPKSSTGWPLAAIIDWKTWGFKNPRRFFSIWPELGR